MLGHPSRGSGQHTLSDSALQRQDGPPTAISVRQVAVRHPMMNLFEAVTRGPAAVHPIRPRGVVCPTAVRNLSVNTG